MNWLFSTTLLNSKVSLTLAIYSRPRRIKLPHFGVGYLSVLKRIIITGYFHITLTQQLKLIYLKHVQIWFGTCIGNDLQQKQKYSKSLIVHSQAESTSGFNSCFLGREGLTSAYMTFSLKLCPDRNWSRLETYNDIAKDKLFWLVCSIISYIHWEKG